MTGEVMLVSKDTGEIMNTLRQGDLCRVTRKESVDKLKSQTKWGEGWQFVKLFSDNVRALEGKLSAGAMMIMFALAPCVTPRSNLIVNDCGEPMNNNDVQRVTGLSRESVSKIMNELVATNAIARSHNGNSYKYFANPYIYCKGNAINDTLDAMFKEYPVRLKNKALLITGTPMISWGEDWSFTKLFTEYFRVVDGKLSSGSVAVMFAIAPYVSYGSNVLCKRGRITEPLTVVDIRKITGVSKPSITKYISELLSNKILANDDNGRFIANPYVYCKGGKIDKSLIAMFKDYQR